MPVPDRPAASARRRTAMAGHLGDEATARVAWEAGTAEVRASALSALGRMGRLQPADLHLALADPDASVRRRACDLAGRSPEGDLVPHLAAILSDGAPEVVEAACYALGELGPRAEQACLVLAGTAVDHPDPLCREAAVAALGSVGSETGLPAVLSACTDKPAVRRRAVIALAAFEGPEVQEALDRATSDSDWQVRQAAEDLVGHRPRPKRRSGPGRAAQEPGALS